MTLIILTVVVIASLIAVLAVYLSVIGVLLNRIADNLDDCLGNVNIIMVQAEVIFGLVSGAPTKPVAWSQERCRCWSKPLRVPPPN
jgi:hypothetical protein